MLAPHSYSFLDIGAFPKAAPCDMGAAGVKTKDNKLGRRKIGKTERAWVLDDSVSWIDHSVLRRESLFSLFFLAIIRVFLNVCLGLFYSEIFFFHYICYFFFLYLFWFRGFQTF